jgi:hypothetical protein
MTKPRAQGRGGETKYHLSRRPIPLELLSVYRWEDAPVSRSSGFHLKSTLSSGSTGETSSNLDHRLLFPIELRYLGRTGGHFTLFAESARARDTWREKLQAAIEARERVLASQRVFDLVPIANQTFLQRGHAADAQAPRDGSRPPAGRPTCSVSFSTPEGHSLVAIGHEDGLWIGLRHDPSSFRLVLHLKLITQCTVLPDFALVLVLADKALYAYPLEALVPSAASAAFQREKEPQKISGAKDVLFFKAGKVGPRLLVIYVKKSGVNQTVFKALEPIAPSDRTNRTLLKRKPDWFRTYKVRRRARLSGILAKRRRTGLFLSVRNLFHHLPPVAALHRLCQGLRAPLARVGAAEDDLVPGLAAHRQERPSRRRAREAV